MKKSKSGSKKPNSRKLDSTVGKAPNAPAGKGKSTERGSIYFLSLDLKGIRCFGPTPQTLNFAGDNGNWSRWTIILGLNGTGKTTILQLLALVAAFDTKRMASELGVDTQVPPDASVLSVGFHPFAMEMLGFSCFRPSAMADAKKGTFHQKHNIVVNAGLQLVRSSSDPKKRPHPHIVSTEFSLEKEHGKGIQFGASNTAFNPTDCEPRVFVVGYGAWRRRGQVQISGSTKAHPLESRIHLFNEMSNLIAADEWFLRVQFASTSDVNPANSSVYRLMFNQVKKAIVSLLPGVEDIETSISDGRDVNPTVKFKTDFGWLPLNQLGYGYQTLVTWIIDFAARLFEEYPNSPNPLAEPAVCLVDELDLHLHPSWQRKVMNYLSTMFPKTQFIVTVHSPLIVQGAAEINANVILLRKIGDHIEVSNDPIDVRGWRADQILASELFDEVPLRAGEPQDFVDERTYLLSKPELSNTERTRVDFLNKQLESFTVGRPSGNRGLPADLLTAIERIEKRLDQEEGTMKSPGNTKPQTSPESATNTRSKALPERGGFRKKD